MDICMYVRMYACVCVCACLVLLSSVCARRGCRWLFPIREKGMNWESQPLQPHERDVCALNTTAPAVVVVVVVVYVRLFQLL